MHASARITNAKASAFTHLAGISLPGGARWIFEDQPRPAEGGAFVRASFEPLPPARAGRFSASETARRFGALLLLDVYWPLPGDGETMSAYAVDTCAETLLDELEQLSIAFLDYAADPTTPAAVADTRLRVVEPPPLAARLPAVDGYARRRVQAAIYWFARYSA